MVEQNIPSRKLSEGEARRLGWLGGAAAETLPEAARREWEIEREIEAEEGAIADAIQSIDSMTKRITEIDARLEKVIAHDQIFVIRKESMAAKKELDKIVHEIKDKYHMENFGKLHGRISGELTGLLKRQQKEFQEAEKKLGASVVDPEGKFRKWMERALEEREKLLRTLMFRLKQLNKKITEHEIVKAVASIGRALEEKKGKNAAVKGRASIKLFVSNLKSVREHLEFVLRKLKEIENFSKKIKKNLEAFLAEVSRARGHT